MVQGYSLYIKHAAIVKINNRSELYVNDSPWIRQSGVLDNSVRSLQALFGNLWKYDLPDKTQASRVGPTVS